MSNFSLIFPEVTGALSDTMFWANILSEQLYKQSSACTNENVTAALQGVNADEAAFRSKNYIFSYFSASFQYVINCNVDYEIMDFAHVKQYIRTSSEALLNLFNLLNYGESYMDVLAYSGGLKDEAPPKFKKFLGENKFFSFLSLLNIAKEGGFGDTLYFMTDEFRREANQAVHASVFLHPIYDNEKKCFNAGRLLCYELAILHKAVTLLYNKYKNNTITYTYTFQNTTYKLNNEICYNNFLQSYSRLKIYVNNISVNYVSYVPYYNVN